MLNEDTITEPPPSVIIVDDDPEEREGLIDELRDYEIEPIPLTGPYGADIDRIVSDIMRTNSPFVVCDHRLQSKNFASFNGSSLIRALSQKNKPAMLLTMFQSTNRLELRETRSSLPVVVNRGDFKVEQLGRYAEICKRELANDPVDERRPHRSLISIEEVIESTGSPELYVTIPSWKRETAIILPIGCVAPHLVEHIKAGDYLLGDVNIGAEGEDDLFFRNVNERVEP